MPTATDLTRAAALPEPGRPVARILIVDDELINRVILAEILRDSGYDVREAQNGNQAITVAQATSPDLILLDIMMPEINGYEACRRLKAAPETCDIPIIFITALHDPADLVRGFDAGAEDYLSKPINAEEVKARVRTQLKLRAATTAIKRYNEELERVVAESSRELIRAERQAAFGQLIQGIVHNLKGPLTTMQGSIEIGRSLLTALNQGIDNEPPPNRAQLQKWGQGAAKALELTASSTTRLQEMINSLMTKSRADQEQELRPCDLNDIIRAELEFLAADLHFKHRIEKNIDLCLEKTTILANPSEIAQVLNNLLGNAKDAMANQALAKISLNTKIINNQVRLTIADNGRGIAPEHLDRIFEPFFTTKHRRRDEPEKNHGLTGTGLGLYMCLRSIRAINGDITVTSTEGQGTTFVVTIPLADSPTLATAPTRAAEQTKPGDSHDPRRLQNPDNR